jgi:hypothetical protein
VALTYAAVWVVALAAWQEGCPDFIRDLCTTLQSHLVACSDTLVIA